MSEKNAVFIVYYYYVLLIINGHFIVKLPESITPNGVVSGSYSKSNMVR